MAEDEIFVNGDKLGIVEALIDRVHNLFEVSLSVNRPSYGEHDRAKIRLASSNISKENIKKTQAYLQAALEIGPNFTKENISLSFQDYIMVLPEVDNIERSQQVVLTYCEENENLIVKGSKVNVDSSLQIITKLYSLSYNTDLAPTLCDSHLQTQLVTEYDKMAIDKKIFDNNRFNTRHHQDSDLSSKTLLSSRQSGDVLTDYNLETDGTPIDRNLTDLSALSTSCWSDSHETESERILSDPQNSPQIEKALKLGYSEEHVVAVLKKLGVTAALVDPNTLLLALIQQSDSTPDSTVEESDNYMKYTVDGDTADNQFIDDSDNLRHIVIDGSNVAMSHGNKDVFSCRGIQLAVEYFKERGHKKITVFVPQWRKESSRNNTQITDQDILKNLEKEKKLVFTPSRRIAGRRVVCYDDRFILELADSHNGIVVSNDNYRDLHNEKPQYKKIAEEQLLQYLFVDDKFMPPQDPLGKHGPTLDNFLRIRPIVSEPLQPCPYGKKCTYGNKCRFSHPERGNRPHRSVTEVLSEQSNQKLKDRAIKMGEKKKKDVSRKKQSLRRTQSMFPEECSSFENLPSTTTSDNKVLKKTLSYAPETDINYILTEHRLILERAISESRETSPVPKVAIQSVGSTDVEPDNMSEQTEICYVRELEPVKSTLPPPSAVSTQLTNTEEVRGTGHLSLAKKLSDEQDRPSRFFESDKDQKTGSDYPLKTLDQQHTVTNFNPTMSPHRMTPADQVHASSQYTFPQSEYPSTYYSGPPTIMRQNTMNQYDNQCPSYPFNERDYSQLRWKGSHPMHAEHLSLTSRQSCPDNLPQQTALQQPSMLRQNSTSDPQLSQTGAEHLSHRGVPRMMYPPQQNTSMLPINRSTSIQPPSLPQQHVLYGRQNSDIHVPYSADQHYYGQQHSHAQFSHRDWPAYPSNFVSPPASMAPVHGMWQTGQSVAPPASQYLGSYQQAMLSPPPPLPIQPHIPSGVEINPTDPRYPVYYHLCSLFNKKEVQAAMMAHPHETDPKILVAFILQLKQSY